MLKKIIEDIKNKSNCSALPCVTVPAEIFDILPDDLKEFYTLCPSNNYETQFQRNRYN